MEKTAKYGKQMEMFELGGLKDQGNTIDKQSKNDVPVGSLQKEVRDDIPINISEGEFVLPADVVRYHGLEKIMNLRQQAKSGLNLMDRMGQMGNSEEASLPDTIPFKPESYNIGGFKQPNLRYNPPTTNIPEQPYKQNVLPTTPVAPVQPIETPKVEVPKTPTMQKEKKTYKYEDLVKAPFGQLPKTETKKYINQETGEELYIPFLEGEPIYPIPAGFVDSGSVERTKEKEQETKTKVATTQVSDSSDGDSSDSTPNTEAYRIASELQQQEGKGFAQSLAEIGKFIVAPGIYIAQNITGKKEEDVSTGVGAPKGIPETLPTARPDNLANIVNDQRAKALGFDDYNDMITKTGVEPSFRFGNKIGDTDITTGAIFGVSGQSENPNTGEVSYTSFENFIDAMKASASSGWLGGYEGAKKVATTNPKAEAYVNYINNIEKEDGTKKYNIKTVTPVETKTITSTETSDTTPSDSAGGVDLAPAGADYEGSRELASQYEDDPSSLSGEPSGGFGETGTASEPGGFSSTSDFGFTAEGGFISKRRAKKIKKKLGGLASRK